MNESYPPLPAGHDSPPPPTSGPGWKRYLTPLIAALVIGVQFFGKLKFLILPALKFVPVILKTGGSMILTIWLYAMVWGWPFAVGFVLLIFVHEGGHLVAARWCGLKVGAPVFIPFMGALIALKEAPKNAWIEAVVGIGGPMAGMAGALVCHNVYVLTGHPMWLGLAYSGYFLNLFNLTPITPLDGGRIVAALTPWLWIPGLGMLVWFMFDHGPNFVLIIILIASLPQVWRLFWSKTDEERRYFELAPRQRIIMGVSYFALAAFLFYQMHNSMAELQSLGHWKH